MKNLKPDQQVERAYWMFYSRPMMASERKRIQDGMLKTDAKNRWRAYQDVGWQLLNSKEFVYIH
jgi:DNA polymerase IIIc chi subunit